MDLRALHRVGQIVPVEHYDLHTIGSSVCRARDHLGAIRNTKNVRVPGALDAADAAYLSGPGEVKRTGVRPPGDLIRVRNVSNA
jgi:hypothetical protein